MSKLVKSIIVQSEDRFQYEIIRENDKSDSWFLVKKVGIEEKVDKRLILVGDLKSISTEIYVGQSIFKENTLYTISIGQLPFSIDKNIDSIIGNRLFFTRLNPKVLGTTQSLLLNASKNRVTSRDSDGVSKSIADSFEKSSKILRIISIEFLNE